MTNSAALLTEPAPHEIDNYIQLADGKWYHKSGAQERALEMAAAEMHKELSRHEHYEAMVDLDEKYPVNADDPRILKGSVGDVNSTEKGSGARYNSGKPPMAYIPIRQQIIVWMGYRNFSGHTLLVMEKLALFEEGKGTMGEVIAVLNTQDLEVASYVWDYGAKKYAAFNWAKGMAWSIPMACISRHMTAILRGEAVDDESGCAHWGHVVCNLLMLEHYSHYYQEGNDLPPPEVFK